MKSIAKNAALDGLGSTLIVSSLIACGGGQGQAKMEGTKGGEPAPSIVGTDGTNGSPVKLPPTTDLPKPPVPPPPPPANPNQINLALKYVSYMGSNGLPVVSNDDSARVVKRVNEIYSQCDINFTLQEYNTVNPVDLGLDFGLASMDQLDKIRYQFDNPKELVVINTGNWNHGWVGPANAWTMMPGNTPSGAVIEGQVSGNPEIVAHELGHYLNLDHVNDPADLMNPIIFSTSTYLSQNQCAIVRQAAVSVRAAARI